MHFSVTSVAHGVETRLLITRISAENELQEFKSITKHLEAFRIQTSIIRHENVSVFKQTLFQTGKSTIVC